jgi:hypothetical protein
MKIYHIKCKNGKQQGAARFSAQTLTPRCLALHREGGAGRGAWRGPSLVAGSSMFERGGGGKAPSWPVATCLREVEEGGWKELMATESS